MQEVGDWWVEVQPPKLGWWKLTGLARPQEPRGQMGQKLTRQVKLLQVPVQDPQTEASHPKPSSTPGD